MSQQKFFIIIHGVLPHVFLLPQDWRDTDNLLKKRSKSYIKMMFSFFTALMAFVEKKRRTFDIKVIYSLDTLPIHMTKNRPGNICMDALFTESYLQLYIFERDYHSSHIFSLPEAKNKFFSIVCYLGHYK